MRVEAGGWDGAARRDVTDLGARRSKLPSKGPCQGGRARDLDSPQALTRCYFPSSSFCIDTCRYVHPTAVTAVASLEVQKALIACLPFPLGGAF